MHDHNENEAFVRLVAAIEPWVEDIVIIGGWAHRLYRLHPEAQALDYAPLLTLDTDVAIPTRLSVKGQDLRERLIAGGFTEQRFGEDKPPATHYQLLDEESGFFAEFLTPLTGSEHGRSGKRKATKRIAGVVSQQLRYLEVLLHAPWTVDLDYSNGFPLEQKKKIRIANPVSFLAHKMLIYGKRGRAKSAKDILYIHDTLETFGAQLEELNAEWNQNIKQRIHPKGVRKIERAVADVFGEVNDAIREAARIDVARDLSAEVVCERCRFGLGQILEGR
ncbi:MAG: nucleotidyltransferase domain-containing protein [Acidobacteriia bacterium]|nr:nucleotidyltransferase domain-containing protein [Terriglobia bacterium]